MGIIVPIRAMISVEKNPKKRAIMLGIVGS